MQVSPNRLLGVPTIGHLFGRNRLWAWRRARAGSFGSLVTIGGNHFATLAGVEHFQGCPFTEGQLAAAGVLHLAEDNHGQT
jgi:hypothetical protein